MDELYKDIQHLLHLYDTDGKNEGRWSAFTIDPNEYFCYDAMAEAIERLRKYLPKETIK
jgi:hypothetical protein